jgi:hypothetical protein
VPCATPSIEANVHSTSSADLVNYIGSMGRGRPDGASMWPRDVQLCVQNDSDS